MSDIVDLDALQPKELKFKYGGEEIVAPAPRTGDLMRLGYLSGQMEKIEGLSSDEIEERVTAIKDQLDKMVPAFVGKTFSLVQLQTIVAMFAAMSMPPNLKELEERGVTVDGSKKA